MRKLSQSFRDRPMSPKQTVIYWTEYVIRNNGAPQLRTSGADMPLYQYFFLDIVLLVIVTISLVTYVTVWLMRRIYNLCIKNLKYRIPFKVDKKKIWTARVDIWIQECKGVILTSFWRSRALNQLWLTIFCFKSKCVGCRWPSNV